MPGKHGLKIKKGRNIIMALIEKVLASKVSRRDFLKGSAAAIGTAGVGLAMSGCTKTDNNLEETTTTEAPTTPEETVAPVTEPIPDLEGGKWVSAACRHNCGGKCLVKAYVKDGVIMRQKTDDVCTDDEINRQQRACLRGFSQQYQARGLDRLKYPMKRKNWSPENPNGRLRGQDEWERISWDEAASYIHDEIERINGTYGDNSILLFGTDGGLLNKLNINYLTSWTTCSWGTWFTPGVLGLGRWL